MVIVSACPMGQAVSIIGKTKGFFVTFFTASWLMEESNGGNRRRSLLTGFKALYRHILL